LGRASSQRIVEQTRRIPIGAKTDQHLSSFGIEPPLFQKVFDGDWQQPFGLTKIPIAPAAQDRKRRRRA
jgi:hypothetical protein